MKSQVSIEMIYQKLIDLEKRISGIEMLLFEVKLPKKYLGYLDKLCEDAKRGRISYHWKKLKKLSSLRISFHKNAVRKLKKIPKNYACRILEALKIIARNPFEHTLDVRKVAGRDYWRLRIGIYGIFYVIILERNELVVLDIRHRRKAYKS